MARAATGEAAGGQDADAVSLAYLQHRWGAAYVLFLPDFTGIPERPQARNSTQRRMAAEARRIQEHAGYAMRHEAWLRQQAAGTGAGS